MGGIYQREALHYRQATLRAETVTLCPKYCKMEKTEHAILGSAQERYSFEEDNIPRTTGAQ